MIMIRSAIAPSDAPKGTTPIVNALNLDVDADEVPKCHKIKVMLANAKMIMNRKFL